MPLMRKSTGMLKEFTNPVDGKLYSFFFLQDTNDTNPASVYTFEDEEPIRKQWWYPFIKKDDIILDIGAAFGSYTLSALAMGATVYSFSPEHEFEILKNSIKENSGFAERSHVYNFGFYSQTGYFKTDTMQFVTPVEYQENRDRYNFDEYNKKNWTGWFIPVKILDDFVAQLAPVKIDFIKLDTEGAELEILKGAVQTLEVYKPKLMVEFHQFKDNQMENKCREFLAQFGYESKSHANGLAVNHGFFIYSL